MRSPPKGFMPFLELKEVGLQVQERKAALRHGRRCEAGFRMQHVVHPLACCALLLWMQSCPQTGACRSQHGSWRPSRCAIA